MVDAAARGDVFGLAGTVVNGRFRVDEQIAEGGFAVVYGAHQVALDRKIALKVLKTPTGYDQHAQAEFRERFAAEARTIARLKHPSIVGVYDFDVSPMPSGELAPWMALEWVDGETLEARLKRGAGAGGKGLAPGQALELLRPVLQALASAHQQGIAHRDIKPANIMVTDGDHGRTVRVLDFGIAKIMRADEEGGTGRTRTGSVPAFSPGYAAPEQVTFSRTGPWTDVHALGLILTELLTGEPPFADPEASVHEQVMAARRPTPAGKGRDVGAFEAVIARAVALSPGDRWKNAGDMLAALDQAVGGAAPRVTARRLPRRTATVAAVASLALAALLAGAWAWRARRAPAPISPPAAVELAPPRASAVTAAAPAIPAAATREAEVQPRPLPAARRRKKAEAAPPAAAPKRADLFDDTK